MAELQEFDGVPTTDLAARTGAPGIMAFDLLESTMDSAHDLAREGAPDGTIVVAEEQTSGRGRERRGWISGRYGVWFTVIARLADTAHLGALPLRVGIAAARALDAFASERVLLKWPNDLYLSGGKLGGILVEARWRERILEWAAIGIGVNLRPPAGMEAAGLDSSARRAEVFEALAAAVFQASRLSGPLQPGELAEFSTRDLARDRTISAPVAGIARGIASSGALLVEVAGALREVRSGSLTLSEAPQSLSANR